MGTRTGEHSGLRVSTLAIGAALTVGMLLALLAYLQARAQHAPDTFDAALHVKNESSVSSVRAEQTVGLQRDPVPQPAEQSAEEENLHAYSGPDSPYSSMMKSPPTEGANPEERTAQYLETTVPVRSGSANRTPPASPYTANTAVPLSEEEEAARAQQYLQQLR